jgi:flagellin-like hook-associated protein FlgL
MSERDTALRADRLTAEEIREIVSNGMKELQEELANITNETFNEIYLLGVRHMAEIINTKLQSRAVNREFMRAIEVLQAEGRTPAEGS